MTLHHLILMRHAKSSWSDLGLNDHARPLNGRGRRSAHAIGTWLQSRGHVPQEALVSSAQRTVETFERLGLGDDVQLGVTDSLYHASADQMLNVLQGASKTSVLVLGHNPGIAEFAGRLVLQAPDHPRFDDYPTAATLVAQFRIDTWRDATWHRAEVVDFIIPRELDE